MIIYCEFIKTMNFGNVNYRADYFEYRTKKSCHAGHNKARAEYA